MGSWESNELKLRQTAVEFCLQMNIIHVKLNHWTIDTVLVSLSSPPTGNSIPVLFSSPSRMSAVTSTCLNTSILNSCRQFQSYLHARLQITVKRRSHWAANNRKCFRRQQILYSHRVHHGSFQITKLLPCVRQCFNDFFLDARKVNVWHPFDKHEHPWTNPDENATFVAFENTHNCSPLSRIGALPVKPDARLLWLQYAIS